MDLEFITGDQFDFSHEVLFSGHECRVIYPAGEKDFWELVTFLDLVNTSIINTPKRGLLFGKTYIEFDESVEDFEIITSSTAILGLDIIDGRSLYNTDPHTMAKLLGIEAGKQSLFRDINTVFAFDGADLNLKYIDFITDAMTTSGSIKPISHTEGVLTNALYEKEIKKLNTCSVSRSRDSVLSVESRLFTGRVSKVGTGYSEVKDVE
jgi:hypothetical protein